MLKLALFVLTILSSASFGICGDLVLRIDTIEYEGDGGKTAQPEGRLLRRIETAVDPDRKFRARCNVGLEELELSGFAHHLRDGSMKLDLQYRHAQFPPPIADLQPNGEQRIPQSSTSVQTSTTLKLGTPTTIGGVASIRESAEHPKKHFTRTEIVASLVEVETVATPQP